MSERWKECGDYLHSHYPGKQTNRPAILKRVALTCGLVQNQARPGCMQGYLPYTRKISREKTFTNFAV